MDARFPLLFLCFLSRQKLRLREDRRESLFAAAAEGCLPPDAEFFRRLPEFETWREKPADWWKRGADELRREHERGHRFLLFGESGFPSGLSSMSDPPWALTLKGSVETLSEPSLSIVGAREPLAESLAWMEEHLGSVLGCLPVTVVSGGARGVDQAAHRLSLRAGRPTVVYLPSGLASLYPADLKDWVMPVLDGGGAFVSEFHPRTPMRKWHFELRNRLIAAHGLATLVIEARERSGTWMTARAAIDNGRPVACLPSSPWETALGGNARLLGEGASPVRDAQDVVMFLAAAIRGVQESSLALDSVSVRVH